MCKIYEEPSIQVIAFIEEDIVRTSNPNDGDFGVGEVPLFG